MNNTPNYSNYVNSDEILKNNIKQLERKKLRKTSNGLGFFVLSYNLFMIVSAIIIEIILLAVTGDSSLLSSSNTVPMFLLTIFVSTLSAFIPGLFYFLFSGNNIFETIPVHKVKADLFFPIIAIGMAAAMIANYASEIVSNNFSLFGLENQISFENSAPTLFGNILYIISTAIVPAFAEEFAFRGVVMGTLRKYGDVFAIITSAILFGAMHGNISQIPFAFILGLIFAYIDCKTNSLLPSITIHFINNFYAVMIDILNTSNIVNDKILNIVYIIVVIVFCLLGIISFIYLSNNYKYFFKMDNKSGTNYQIISEFSLKEKIIECFSTFGVLISLSIFFVTTLYSLGIFGNITTN
ncbi:MAG: CPBP family intramembrane metalloprotease [Ruminococcus sp.]|nr:CPBP family intramembrane metalloprotease [Ruminococcus sp.]